MSSPMTAAQTFNREFLEIRAKILELAASFDRLQRGEGSVADEPRMAKIRAAVEVLLDEELVDRAEQVQLIFSREYQSDWRQKFAIKPR